LLKKGNNNHQAIQAATANKVTMGAAELQQSAPVHEKSNFDTHRVTSVPEDEGLFLLCTILLLLLMFFLYLY
jgi:hypothetical protein